MLRSWTLPPLLLIILVSLAGFVLQTFQLAWIRSKRFNHPIEITLPAQTPDQYAGHRTSQDPNTYPVRDGKLTFGPLSFSIAASVVSLVMAGIVLYAQYNSVRFTSFLQSTIGTWPLPKTKPSALLQRQKIEAALLTTSGIILMTSLIVTFVTVSKIGANIQISITPSGVSYYPKHTNTKNPSSSWNVDPENWILKLWKEVDKQRLKVTTSEDLGAQYQVARAARWIILPNMVLTWILIIWMWWSIKRMEKSTANEDQTQTMIGENDQREESPRIDSGRANTDS